MDIITLGNLTLCKYTLVTFTLGNLALSPRFSTKIAYVQPKILPPFKIFYTASVTFSSSELDNYPLGVKVSIILPL